MAAKYILNQDLNGIEIIFDSKPEAATLEALKANGYRWHRMKKLWYAKQTPERIAIAESIADGEANQTKTESKTKENVINLDNLGENKPHLYGADLAKAIREDLKKRGVKGCTVRARRITYDTGITVTIKANEADFVSLEEAKNRYTFEHFFANAATRGFFNGERWIYNLSEYSEEDQKEQYNKFMKYQTSKAPQVNKYYLNDSRKDFYTITTAFFNKILAVFKIANQWNYDNSDPMTDYFDVGYYLDIDIKAPDNLSIRETMTDEERKAYAEEVRQEEEKRAAEVAAWKAEEAERRKQAEEAEKIWKEKTRKVEEETVITDLEKDNYIYVTNLLGGIGKECSLAELTEEIERRNPAPIDAVITRKVDFTREAFAAFCELFLQSFDFLAGRGGTDSADVRTKEIKHIYDLTTDQRNDIKWYNCNCVGCYVENELQLVCDPQGYNYTRYAYKPTEETETKNAAEELKKQEEESKTKNPFYFPAPVTEQAENIKPGQAVTIYQCDGWILNNIYAGAGIVSKVEPGTYAQYNGIYIYFTNSKKAFVRDNKDCLIYKGIKQPLPETVTRRKVSDSMYELLNYNELFPAVLDYYGKQGESPIFDTIQR